MENSTEAFYSNVSSLDVKEIEGSTAWPYSERPETYIMPVVFAFIFIIGVLGNGTLVVVFMRHRAMRNAPNTYILCLALADLLVIIACVPFTSFIYVYESWPFGIVFCKVSECAKDISIGVSVFTLIALSADRFFAIVDPFKRLHASGGGTWPTRLPIAVSTLIWLLAVALATPGAIGAHLKILYPSDIRICYPFPPEWGDNYPKYIIVFRFLTFYFIPLVIIGFFYILIAQHLITSTRNVPGEMQGAHRQIRARRKVAITVLAFVMVFAICFLPLHIYMLWFYFNPTAGVDYNAFWHAFRITGFCLSFLNSCINPVALYCVSGTFRKHFNRYLLCRRPASRSQCGASNCRTATSMTLTTSKMQQSIYGKNKNQMVMSMRQPADCQETSVILLGCPCPNGNNTLMTSNI